MNLARTRIGKIALHLVILVACVAWFTPVLSLLVSSLRTDPDSRASGWWTAFLRPLFTLDNYTRSFEVMGGLDTVASTLVMAIPTTVLTVTISAFAAFALARMQFRGKQVVFILIVALLVVPPQVTLVPMLQLFSAMGLQGSIVAVWLYQVGFTVPFGVFLVRGFLYEFPDEIVEAARMDGASDFRIFLQIVLPAAAPILAALGILQFLWSWNDLLIPLLFLSGNGDFTPITVEVAGLVQANGQGQNLLSAGTFISILIPLAVLIGLQRYFVAGITAGAVKG